MTFAVLQMRMFLLILRKVQLYTLQGGVYTPFQSLSLWQKHLLQLTIITERWAYLRLTHPDGNKRSVKLQRVLDLMPGSIGNLIMQKTK
jgi:hypothetical protein